MKNIKSTRKKYYEKLGFFRPTPKTPPNTPQLKPESNIVINYDLINLINKERNNER